MRMRTAHCRGVVWFSARLALMLVMLLPMSSAWASAGKVLMAIGDTSRVSAAGVRGALKTGDSVDSGDTLITGPDSRLQWRTNDGGLFALRPDTQFKVDEYRYDAGKKQGRSFFSLAKGGFRTLTGRIGKKRHEDYQVKTPVATLGIRGTHYLVQLCLSGAAATVAACGGASPGLYMATIAGAVLLGNRADALQVGANQAAFVRSLSAPPELLPAVPGMLMDTVLPGAGGSSRGRRAPVVAGAGPMPPGPPPPPPVLPKVGSDADGPADLTGGELPPEVVTEPVVETPVVVAPVTPPTPTPPPVAEEPPATDPVVKTDPSPGNTDPGTTTTPPPTTEPGLQFTALGSGHIGTSTELHTNLGIVAVADVDAVTTDPDLSFSALYDVSGTSVQILDAGQDPDTGVFWGRFINGVFNVPGVDPNGNATSTDPFDNRSLHYVSGTRPDFVSLPISGTANYALAGNTTPTDNFGSSGTLNSASLVADFTNQKVQVSLEVGINSSTWLVDNVAVPLNGSGGDFGGSVPVDIGFVGSSAPITGSGEVAGFFSGTPLDSSQPPPAAGLGFSLFDGDQSVVSGAAAFKAQ